MSVMILATMGGLISFLSTSLGAVGSFFSNRSQKKFRWKLSIDFALGLMVSASAFTLIGPAALESQHSLSVIVSSVLMGVLFVMVMKKGINSLQGSEVKMNTNHLLLVTVLMLHNFPEGLASGAALAGLGWSASLPIIGGISLQNIPEGALMVFCLRAMGWGQKRAFLGGIGSGVVEMVGGVFAGVLLHSVNNVLPLLLSFAGGAMMASVLSELVEGEKTVWQRVASRQFALGFLCLPLVQLVSF